MRKLLNRKFAAPVHVQAVELGFHELHKLLFRYSRFTKRDERAWLMRMNWLFSSLK